MSSCPRGHKGHYAEAPTKVEDTKSTLAGRHQKPSVFLVRIRDLSVWALFCPLSFGLHTGLVRGAPGRGLGRVPLCPLRFCTLWALARVLCPLGRPLLQSLTVGFHIFSTRNHQFSLKSLENSSNFGPKMTRNKKNTWGHTYPIHVWGDGPGYTEDI